MKNKTAYLSVIQRICGLVLFITLIGVPVLSAQTTAKLDVSIALKVKDGDLKNALVTITRKGEPFKVLDPGKGETSVELPLGYEYQFSFAKLGYITQNIYIDTHVPEHRENGTFRKQIFKVQLEKEREEDRHDVKLAYNMDIEDFDYIKGNISKTNKVKPENTTTAKTKADWLDVRGQTDTLKKNTKAGSKIKDKKVIQQDTKRITTITIVIDEKEYIYKKEEYDWGGTFFYKNGVAITADTYRSETEE